jgi:hypothetical protein
MLETLAVLNLLSIIALCAIVWTKVRTPAPPPPIPVKSIDVDGVLRELHTLSRNSGARVHIHDIEQKLKDAAR